MAPDAHKNFAYSTVLTAPSPASSGTSLVVQSGDGAKFPAVPFNATVWPVFANPLTSNAEIVRVTAISTDTFTITRSQESSSARSIVVGDQIAATITAKTLTDAETATAGATGATGPQGLDGMDGQPGATGNQGTTGPTGPAGAGAGGTKQVAIPLTVPDSSGNGYAALLSTSNIRELIAAFTKDVDGDWWGIVRVPQDYSSTPKIILRIAANATSGVTRLIVASSAKTDAEVVDAALTAETAQDITVPGTAYTLKDVTFTLASGPAAGDSLTVKVTHNGAHANDTLSVDTLLYECVFQYSA